jgi:S1-C subfamily serine protease
VAKTKWPVLTTSNIKPEEAAPFSAALARFVFEDNAYLIVRLPNPSTPGTTVEDVETAARLKSMGFADRDVLLQVNKRPVASKAQLAAAMNARTGADPFLFRSVRGSDQPVLIVVRIASEAPPESEVKLNAAEETATSVEVDGKALEQKYGNADPMQLIGALQPRFWKSPDGSFIGVTSDNFSDFPVATQVGVRNGDIVYSVNGVTLQSEADLLDIENRIEEADSYKVGIIRNGQPMTITVRVR